VARFTNFNQNSNHLLSQRSSAKWPSADKIGSWHFWLSPPRALSDKTNWTFITGHQTLVRGMQSVPATSSQLSPCRPFGQAGRKRHISLHLGAHCLKNRHSTAAQKSSLLRFIVSVNPLPYTRAKLAGQREKKEPPTAHPRFIIQKETDGSP
jgi:hypothetical protein